MSTFQTNAELFTKLAYAHLLASLFSCADDLDWAAYCFKQSERYSRFAAMTPEGK